MTKLNQKHGLLDAAIVFAPSDIVTDTAIKSVKKGGTIVIATIGERPEFIAFEEKTIRGTLIGSTKDMEQVIKICDENKIEVIYETFPLEKANEALQKLKDSKIEVARAINGIELCIEALKKSHGTEIPMNLNNASSNKIAFTRKFPKNKHVIFFCLQKTLHIVGLYSRFVREPDFPAP